MRIAAAETLNRSAKGRTNSCRASLARCCSYERIAAVNSSPASPGRAMRFLRRRMRGFALPTRRPPCGAQIDEIVAAALEEAR